MKEHRSIKDVVGKMYRGINDRYIEFSTQRESEDKWEVLQAFMKKQMEISRTWRGSMLLPQLASSTMPRKLSMPVPSRTSRISLAPVLAAKGATRLQQEVHEGDGQ